jgi:nondiscriminating glutamyl-tRNA synthetase
MSDLVVRFAPSPTGSLHVGGARTALFNDLFHRREGGRFILRIEDTDRAREVEGSDRGLLEDFAWLGIEFTEGVHLGGNRAPYRQSEREGIHRELIGSLLERGAFYRCFCTTEQLDELKRHNTAAGLPPRYDRRCRSVDKVESDKRAAAGESFVLRLPIDQTRHYIIPDLFKGDVSFAGQNLDDPVVVKPDGKPTGVLAGALDDYSMGVTHILRGDEWLPSTPYQYAMFEALGGSIPLWGHLSLLVDESHAKLSKRSPWMAVRELRDEGILPDAICRYLAGLGRTTIPDNLGWNRQSLVEEFNLKSYRSGEVVYSRQSLLAENSRLIQMLTGEELHSRLLRWDPTVEELLKRYSAETVTAVLMLAREESSSLSDVREHLRSFDRDPDWSVLDWGDRETAARVLRTLLESCRSVEWTESGIAAIIQTTGKYLSVKGRDLYTPIRLSIIGEEHGPKLAILLRCLGLETFKRRLEGAVSALTGSL